jgi:hypothetical protein
MKMRFSKAREKIRRDCLGQKGNRRGTKCKESEDRRTIRKIRKQKEREKKR